MEFGSYDLDGGVFFGQSCDLAPIILIDPLVASILPGDTFAGIYAYGEMTMPIFTTGTCFFGISAKAGAGVFFAAEGPTYGGRLSLGLSGVAPAQSGIGDALIFTGLTTTSGPDTYAWLSWQPTTPAVPRAASSPCIAKMAALAPLRRSLASCRFPRSWSKSPTSLTSARWRSRPLSSLCCTRTTPICRAPPRTSSTTFCYSTASPSSKAHATNTYSCALRRGRKSSASSLRKRFTRMQLLTANAWQEAAATWREPGFPQTPTDPATGIAQLDSELFCAWLTIQERKEGRLTGAQHYRLPTAAEAMRIRPSPRSNITYRICGASWATGSLAELRANPPRCATRFQSTAEVGFRCVLDLRTTVQDVIATDSE